MKRNSGRRTAQVSLAALGLACVVAVACGGGDKGGSTLDSSSGGSSSTGASSHNAGQTSSAANGTGASGIQLNTGGQDGAFAEGGGPGAGGADCGATRVAADPPLVNVLLVVDKSLSMNDTPKGFQVDKWTALSDALSTTLDATSDKISYGLDLFPYSGKSGQALADSCEMPSTGAVVVPVQSGTKAQPLILAALKANPPSGATPTAAALARADAYFTTGAGKSLKGEKYVLLATDGGPNCNPDLSCKLDSCTVNLDGKLCGPADVNCCDPKLDPKGASNCLDQDAAVGAVGQLAQDGIKTFVVGIPGTEAYVDTLNALAAQSGVDNPDAPPDYFEVSAKSGTPGLSAVLERITTGLITSCRLQLEEAPPVPNDVYVVIDGVAIEHGTADGWEYDTSVSPPIVVIQGSTCDKLEADGAEYINVSYGCPDYKPPR